MTTYTIRATRDAFEIGYATIQASTPEEAIDIFNARKDEDPELIDWVEFGCPNNDTDPADLNDIENAEDDEEPEGEGDGLDDDDPGTFAWRTAKRLQQAYAQGDSETIAELIADLASHYKPY